VAAAAAAAGPSSWQRCTAPGPRTGRCRVGPRGSSTRTSWGAPPGPGAELSLPARAPSRKSSSRGRHLQCAQGCSLVNQFKLNQLVQWT
jgi:hypothetical protein